MNHINLVTRSQQPRLATQFQSDFFDGFSLELADRDDLLAESFRLRYRVYVDEMKFERPEDCPGGVECDAFDSRSLTVLLRHNASRRFIGCVRVIVADPVDKTRPFPFEIAALDQIASRSELLHQTPRERIGEVSRLAVVQEFRRRKCDREAGLYTLPELAHFDSDPRRHNIPPALGLIFAAAWLGIEVGLEAVFVMMELRLARLLRSLGMTFRQVAEPVEYHGLRAPFEITSETLLGDASPPLRAALDLVRDKTADALQRVDGPLLRAARKSH
ncbi:MAG: PEP-CTERM/exosortase system-associated acyltransferase [Gammaproteobacteria bacterium]